MKGPGGEGRLFTCMAAKNALGYIGVAQRKSGGPITHRSEDRNLSQIVYSQGFFWTRCLLVVFLHIFLPVSFCVPDPSNY
jgi:hypothetical protein